MGTVKKFKLGNKTLKIKHDSDPESPRAWDNLARMIFVGNHKHLGDDHNVDFRYRYPSRECFIEVGALDVIKHFKKEGLDVAYITPVHIYSHSGSSISTSYGYPYNDRWDSGTCGFAVLTKQDIRKNWNLKNVTKKYLDWAIRILEGEVETLDTYIRGEVYGFVLKEDGEEVDSCWGFYGNDILKNGILEHVGNEWGEIVKAEQ